MKKKLVKITKNTLLSEIVEMYPELGEVLEGDYGFHCVSCFASEMETLEQGAAVHGIEGAELDELLETLNELAQEIGKA